jgi:hypothetical protein
MRTWMARAVPWGCAVPGTYPLSLYRGDTYAWQFTFWTDTAKTQPLDLTGSTPKAEIRYSTGGVDVLAMTCTLTPPNIVNVSLPAATWTAWPFKPSSRPSWDLQITTAGGAVTTYVAGPVVVVGDITDSVAEA